MNADQIEDQLSAAAALLEATSAAHLAYVAGDGGPRVVPVGFYWTGAEFVISTAATAPKVAAITAAPDLALSIEGGGSPSDARALSVRGHARVTIVDGVVEEYLLAARKSMAADEAAQFERNCRAMYDRMARIAVTPRWARYFDFNAGRMPRFLQELATAAADRDASAQREPEG